MKSVYFHTDEAIHKKFKMICAINDIDMGKTMTELMQNYVSKNQSLIDNPEIQDNLPPELPKFYESQDKWSTYVRKSNKEGIENMATRIMFLRYLIHLYLIDKDRDDKIKEALIEHNGNQTKASERLGLSQSALSERVSALEHELGARLFFRTTRC